MRAAEHPVDADLARRRDRSQFIRLARRDNFEHDFQAVLVGLAAYFAQLGRARADVLESDVAQAAAANLLIDAGGLVDRAVVVGQHEHELDHGELRWAFEGGVREGGRRGSLTGPGSRSPSPLMT